MKTARQKLQAFRPVGSLPSMDPGPLPKILGEEMPSLEPTRIGRFRLQQALRNKFGPNYRNHPMSRYAELHFEKERAYVTALAKMKMGGSR